MKLKYRFFIILLLFIATIPLVDLLHPGLPVMHDGQDHVARIANFYQSLSEGNIIPRWAANLNWGFGHPILMFLYPLPSYIASFFHFVGFSFVDSTKLVFALGFIASILTIFIWVQAQWGILAGFLAGLLYGFAPYRFVDLYVRGAIGEHIAFVFPPLILYGLLQFVRKENPQWWGVMISLSMAGLILSHNAVSLMFLPVIFFYAVYLFFFEAKYRKIFVIYSMCYLFLGFMVSIFFWMPAFFEGKYTLRDIVTKGDFRDRFVPFEWFFNSPWNYRGGNQFSKAVGLLQWVAVLGSFITFLKVKDRKVRWVIGFCLLVFGISLFLMTLPSEIVWEKVSLLQKFQFPWRFLTLSVFLTSVLGAVAMSQLPKKYHALVIVGSILAIVVSTFPMWHASAYSMKPKGYYTGIYDSTTDTGESSPIWSTRFMERRAKDFIEVIEGSAVTTSLRRTSTRHDYVIKAATRARIVENTLYFPGWRIYSDKELMPIEFQDPNYRGLMTFWVEPGSHEVTVVFGDTKLRRVANTFSLAGLGLLLASVMIPIWKRGT